MKLEFKIVKKASSFRLPLATQWKSISNSSSTLDFNCTPPHCRLRRRDYHALFSARQVTKWINEVCHCPSLSHGHPTFYLINISHAGWVIRQINRQLRDQSKVCIKNLEGWGSGVLLSGFILSWCSINLLRTSGLNR